MRPTKAVVATLVLSLVLPAPAASADGAPAPEPLAARVNGRPVTATELDRFVATQLYRLREAEYQTRLEGLKQLVAPGLLEDEAKARGIDVEALLAQEVAGRIPDPSPAELAAVATFMKEKLPADPKKAQAAVLKTVRAQREQGRREAFLAELWAKAKVDLVLEPPRALLPSSPGDPSRGRPDAPVRIVEFGDFQCTQCAAVGGAVGALEARHPGLLHVVFKQMPLSVHEHSREAAELSLCAADQGKFWELHDWMFGNQDKLGKDAVLAAAPGLGLDPDILRACAESGAHAPEIERDLAITRQLGVKTTPTVLVNGRLLVGDAAITQLAGVVEDELKRAAR